MVVRHSILALYTRGWLQISIFNISTDHQVQGRVSTDTRKGPARKNLHTHTNTYMNHLEWLSTTVPLVLIQAIPGSMPATTQEEERYGEPCQRTHL